VRTNHFADAVEGCDGLLDELRPLGVDAGYGHALVALAYHHLAGAAAGEQAALWWSRATLLVAAPALLDRFAELRPLLGAGCRCTASQLQGTG
jgi:hypothetical protein